MNALTEKANNLRSQLPKSGPGTPPQMKGTLLGTLSHKDGQIRLSWDEYEGRHFLSVRLWTTDDGQAYWPSKVGFTVKLKDIPALGDAIGAAIDLALQATKAKPETSHTSEGTDLF